MDHSHDDRLIESYMFSEHRPSANDPIDQQFAKPIEDEDIFGLAESVGQSQETNVEPDKRQKALLMRQNLKEQILAKGIKPRKLRSDCDKDGMIEVNFDLKPPESPCKGRVIYDGLVQKSIDCKKGIYGGRKITWPIYSEVLRKRICSEKRKVWDSFQKPTADNFNDEEEIVS